VRRARFLFTLIAFTLSEGLSAIPVNANVALPITEGHTVYRIQYKTTKNENEKVTETYIFAFAHGLSGKTVLIGAIPAKISKTFTGAGDLALFLKHTVYQIDGPLYTSRLALVGGIKFPTGKDKFTSESTDWRVGVVYTMQDDSHEIDISTLYSINTEAEGIEQGDTFNHDLAYQFRLFPWNLPEEGIPTTINVVGELNGISIQKTEVDGMQQENTGGYKLFISPGLQIVGSQIIVEGIVQFPIIQDLNGTQPEERYRTVVSTRFQF